MSTLVQNVFIRLNQHILMPPPPPFPATLLIIFSWILSLCTKYFGSTLAFHDISDDFLHFECVCGAVVNVYMICTGITNVQRL